MVDECERRLDAMDARLFATLPGEVLVRYSAYPIETGDLPVDNLDQIAIKGPCRFISPANPRLWRQNSYRSEVVSNPTWLDVCRLANEMIHATGDAHCYFLEGVRQTDIEGDIAVFDFEMGS